MSTPIQLEWIAARPVAQTRVWAESKLFPVFAQYGFRVARVSDDVVVFSRRRTAWWLALISVLAYWLSPDEKAQITVTFAGHAVEGSRMTVFGDVPAPVRKVLLEIPGCQETLSSR